MDVSPTLTAEGDARSPDWTAGRITAVVTGALLLLLALGLLGGAGTALWADRTQREDGYVTTDEHAFSSTGSALASIAGACRNSTATRPSGATWRAMPANVATIPALSCG